MLLPEGFEEHPNAHYPVMYYQGHFNATFTAFRPPGRRRAVDAAGAAARIRLQALSGLDLPPSAAHVDRDHPGCQSFLRRFLRGEFRQRRPLWRRPDAGAVPHIEKQFRGIGQPWARAVLWRLTGGWRALAQQVFYPDFFNGAWIFCPDPIDFTPTPWSISTKTRTPSSPRALEAGPHSHDARNRRHDHLRYG